MFFLVVAFLAGGHYIVFSRFTGRVLENLDGAENVIQFDALSLYRKYTDRFDIDSVHEEERKETARKVADIVLAELKRDSGREAVD